MAVLPVIDGSDWSVSVNGVGHAQLPASTDAEPLSPLWWTTRLYNRLLARRWSLRFYNAYYTGEHPLPWLAPQVQDSFRRILRMTRTNYMGLVCDATTERLEVLGFRVGDSEDADAAAAELWQRSNLDAYSGDAFLEAVKTGCSFMMVTTDGRITVEHPSQVVVENEPGDMRERAAALKMWADDRVGRVYATLFLPDRIYKFEGEPGSEPRDWTPRQVGNEAWPARNNLGSVPVFELMNNPQWTYDVNGVLTYGGVSEMRDVIDIQDRINKTIADRLMTQDFGAFPQKWANNWEEDTEVQLNIGQDRLITATGETTFGQFQAAALDPYSAAKSEDVKDIASRTRTPSQYLLGEIVNVSGDALQAAESGLVSKIRQRQRPFAEVLEEVMRTALAATGDTRADDTGMETIWRNPKYRSEAAAADAAVKLRTAEINTLRQARIDVGYTEREITRMEAEERRDALRRAVAAAMAPTPPQPPAPDQQQPAQGQQMPMQQQPPQ